MPESGAAGEGRPQDPSGQGKPGPAGADGPGRPEHPDGRDGRAGPEQREGLPDRGQGAPDLWAELIRVAEQAAAGRPLDAVIPAWRRRTRGEQRWPITASVVVAIVLQMLLSNSLNKPLPHLLLPLLEIALGIFLSIANPVRVERRGPVVRAASIALILLISAANAVSAVLLIRAIMEGAADTASALPLLATGASIWATNVIAFASLVLGVRPRRPGASRRWHPPAPGPDVPADGLARAGAAGLGAALRGLPVPVVHERDRVQPDRRDAAGPVGEADHGGPVGGVAWPSARWSSPARSTSCGSRAESAFPALAAGYRLVVYF